MRPRERDWLTPHRVALRLGVSYHKVHSFIDAGELRAARLYGPKGHPRWLIHRTEAERFVQRLTQTPQQR